MIKIFKKRKARKRQIRPKIPKLSLFKKSKKKRARQKEIKKRKNFFPALFVNMLLWVFVALIIYFVDPITNGAVQMLFAFIFLSLVFSFSLLFANTRRGFIASMSVVFFMILRYLGVGNLINLLLLLGLVAAIEFYFHKN